MLRSLGLIAITVLFMLVGGRYVAGQDKAKPVRPNLLPGPGVADPATKVGYFPNPAGGIDALGLATGKLLWTSKDASRPLLAGADRVFAQKDIAGKPNQFRIVVLEAGKEGKRVLETEPIMLLDWVSVSVTHGRTYRSAARLDGNHLFVAWEARAFYAGGARPTPEIEKAARKEATGVIRIDVTTGKFESLAAAKIKEGGYFPLAGDVLSAKAGDLTLSCEDGPAKNAKNPFQRQRTLQAVNASKQVVWRHEIAAPIFLPPLP
jgi:hypothetical protein